VVAKKERENTCVGINHTVELGKSRCVKTMRETGRGSGGIKDRRKAFESLQRERSRAAVPAQPAALIQRKNKVTIYC